MGHHVIRTKRYPYIVGCKIFIPESQEYLALNPETWPDNVTCRKWEPAWKRNQGYSGGFGSDEWGQGQEYNGDSRSRERY